MTITEICEELGVSENYLRKQWAAIRATRAKHGLYLYKVGRGDSAQYGVRRQGEEKVRWEPLKKNGR
jgi:hypothetical protein